MTTSQSNNLWQIQILDKVTNEYVTYIKTNMIENNLEKHIITSYYGSSTRQGELGTFYYNETNEIIPLKIRVINNNLEIVLDFELTSEIINEIIKSNDINKYKINNIIIHYRDLHRFENYPFEISGIVLLK